MLIRQGISAFPYLSAILLSCVVGLLVILCIPEQRKTQIKWVSAIFSGITLVVSAYLFLAYDKSQGGLQFVERLQWVPPLGIHYFNAADGFNLPNLLPPASCSSPACSPCGNWRCGLRNIMPSISSWSPVYLAFL